MHQELYVTGRRAGPRLQRQRDGDLFLRGLARSSAAIRSIAALRRRGPRRASRARREARAPALHLPRRVPRGDRAAERAGLALRTSSPSVMRYAKQQDLPRRHGGRCGSSCSTSTASTSPSYDVAEKLRGGRRTATELGLRGFNVDGEGNLLFTIQPLFRAFVMSPRGRAARLRPEGQRARQVQHRGRHRAGRRRQLSTSSDLLKSAVLVFDRDLQWVKEFGYRGRQPGSLVAPEEIVAAEREAVRLEPRTPRRERLPRRLR